LSSDLWFFDNNPTKYDIILEKNAIQKRNAKNPSVNNVKYYIDPLARLKRIRELKEVQNK
jgi:hypothetical protein